MGWKSPGRAVGVYSLLQLRALRFSGVFRFECEISRGYLLGPIYCWHAAHMCRWGTQPALHRCTVAQGLAISFSVPHHVLPPCAHSVHSPLPAASQTVMGLLMSCTTLAALLMWTGQLPLAAGDGLPVPVAPKTILFIFIDGAGSSAHRPFPSKQALSEVLLQGFLPLGSPSSWPKPPPLLSTPHPTHSLACSIADLGWYDTSVHNPAAPTPELGRLAHEEGMILNRS